MASLATGGYTQDQMIPSQSTFTKPQQFLSAIDDAFDAFCEAAECHQPFLNEGKYDTSPRNSFCFHSGDDSVKLILGGGKSFFIVLEEPRGRLKQRNFNGFEDRAYPRMNCFEKFYPTH